MKKTIATAQETKRLMAKHQFHTKKKLGQNFLVDANIIQKIVAAAALDEADIVVEIGPGMGALTQQLAAVAGQVVAVELDASLIPILQETFADTPNITIQQGDALKLDYEALLAPIRQRGQYRPGFVVVANLPYYITTPITMGLLESGASWRRLVLMVQKEVAQRMQAAPGGKDYGALSIGVQYRAAAEIAFLVPPTVFIPRPAVDSAVVVLERLAQPPVQVADEALFFCLVQAGFAQRRKTLRNACSSGLQLEKSRLEQIFLQAGIDGGRRAETLSLAELAKLTNVIQAQIKDSYE